MSVELHPSIYLSISVYNIYLSINQGREFKWYNVWTAAMK